MKRGLLIILMLHVAILSCYAQKYEIKGKVLSADTELPITDVNITVVGQPIGTTTDSIGNFILIAHQLPVHLYFSHIGYSIDQVLVTERLVEKLEIILEPEVANINEVVVSPEKITKVDVGDTLNILDYNIIGDKILLVASPYKNQLNERLYLTDLSGRQIDNYALKNMGRSIKIPEEMASKYMFLYEDFMGNIQILTRSCLHQIEISDDKIALGRKTTYPDFLKYLLPTKLLLGRSLYYQESSRTLNITKRAGPDSRRPQIVKTVYDPKGVSKGPHDPSRYIEAAPRDRIKTIYKNVSSPIISYNDEAYIFDFFMNNIEVFDSLGISKRIIPIDFHLETYRYFLNLFEATDLNQQEFKQKILVDKLTKKIYALFNPFGKRAILKEINPINGEVVREIEIPDLPNVYNFSVSNSSVYFMYHVKVYPFYTNLYRLKI